MIQRQQLRNQLRSLRNQLTAEQQQVASENIARQFISESLFKGCHSIALYIANDGEIDPIVIAKRAWSENIPVYLPVLDRNNEGHLLFQKWTCDSRFEKNKFGIPEPVSRQEESIAAEELHTVLLPLVGFDLQGNRLGMGGGFYDRTFAFKNEQVSLPKLIGLAHECQHVTELESQNWDIPLDYVLTDRGQHL